MVYISAILAHVELGKPYILIFESYLLTNRKKNANDNIKNKVLI